MVHKMLYFYGGHKCGTHALVKAVELLGVPIAPGRALIHHDLYAEAIIEQGTVFIYRHPRNALVSAVRGRMQGVVTPGLLIAAMHDFYPRWIDGYLPYLSDPQVLAVRLSDLRTDGGETIRQIAKHIGKPYLEGAYERLHGMTYSWNEEWSRWQDHWEPVVDEAWVEERGPEIEKAFGYG